MFDERDRFVIEDYQRKPAFSSFLPGIAGPMGIPMWCFYNNRGQGVCSFGAKDKDHAIMEFSPAHVAYQNNSRTGFRTFAKVNGRLAELFTSRCRMHIGMSELEIRENTGSIEASALYYGVPDERAALLARVLSVTNRGNETMELELLDGLPAVVPYGVDQDSLKNMTQLAKAWMRVEDVKEGLACFRVRASMADTACVTEVRGGNFCLAWDGEGNLLRPLVQPSLVFGEDTSLSCPESFAAHSLKELCAAEQITENLFPCCLMPVSVTLNPGETAQIYSLYGQAERKDLVQEIAAKTGTPEKMGMPGNGGTSKENRILEKGGISERVGVSEENEVPERTGAPEKGGIPAWFGNKRRQAAGLVEELCDRIRVRTADPVFDAYCKQTYLDNLLRGGAPMFFEHDGRKAPFYIYSRKHGDPEREYNYFSLGGEYYAQGNANYRDVNQNRRCDVLFEPKLGEENIHTFYDLIQTDGYNPLVLTAAVYTLPEKKKEEFVSRLPEAAELFGRAFTPGELAMAAEDAGLSGQEVQQLVSEVICAAESRPCADFKEGYWCDHWTYNLDLIESYLTVFPEKEETLLFENRRYRWYESHVMVNPRTRRYVMTDKGLRQYHALDETVREETAWEEEAPGESARGETSQGETIQSASACGETTQEATVQQGTVSQKSGRQNWMCTADGREARSTLIEKLLLLCAVKTATLDPAGMGVEMEGGKPGWYDALNGLPGLLGSSMAESCELARLLDFTAAALERKGDDMEVYSEIADLLEETDKILRETELMVGNCTIWETGSEAERGQYREKGSEVDNSQCQKEDLVSGNRLIRQTDALWIRWDRLNSMKEAYREAVLRGYSGERRQLSCSEAAGYLRRMEKAVTDGIRRAESYMDGICPTYFTFHVTQVRNTTDGVIPTELQPCVLPLFLEGPVHRMKLDASEAKKRDMARRIQESSLYDGELQMYKVNADLREVSLEAGRARAFSPGWLENESIWLHMEYKWLLEMLKSGLYDVFAEAFHRAAVPFLDAERYGRSPLENVSFIASSANPDSSVHGRGFVARLSGSTAEFLQMWQIMFFGRRPFRLEEGRLCLEFKPFIPDYLMPEEGVVEAMFLGHIPVVYRAEGCSALVPGKTTAIRYILTKTDGEEIIVGGARLTAHLAEAVRDGQVAGILVVMRTCSA